MWMPSPFFVRLEFGTIFYVVSRALPAAPYRRHMFAGACRVCRRLAKYGRLMDTSRQHPCNSIVLWLLCIISLATDVRVFMRCSDLLLVLLLEWGLNGLMIFDTSNFVWCFTCLFNLRRSFLCTENQHAVACSGETGVLYGLGLHGTWEWYGF